MLDKQKLRTKLLKELGTWNCKSCFICGKGINRSDIEEGNFEKIDKKYIHSSCFNNHIPRLD